MQNMDQHPENNVSLGLNRYVLNGIKFGTRNVVVLETGFTGTGKVDSGTGMTMLSSYR